MAGARKRKASKKKNKKGETLDSNNQHHHSNDSSTNSHGSVDDSKSLEERDSDGGDLEREEEEEEIVDQREADTAKGEGFEEEVVEVATEEKSLENGSGGADFSAVNVAEENPIVVHVSEEDSAAGNFAVEDREVAVVEEDEKSVIAESGELRVENPSCWALDDKGIVDCDEEEEVMELNGSVGAQINDDEEEDLVKEVVQLAPEEVVSAGDESLVMPVPPDVVRSELTKNVDSSFSQVSNEKDELSSVIEAQKSEQIENPVKVVPIDDEEKSSEAPAVTPVSNGVVNNGKSLETDNLGAAAAINISREVNNGKELEIQKKPSEDQPPIGSNPLPVRRSSWMGCCGLFEVFSGSNR